ncbi:MAG TPA: hypothetical protein VGW78_03490 [Candidatus Babeliales bacterium]|nr:hypothetical protein [Candidatus Babeliales bacterium]
MKVLGTIYIYCIALLCYCAVGLYAQQPGAFDALSKKISTIPLTPQSFSALQQEASAIIPKLPDQCRREITLAIDEDKARITFQEKRKADPIHKFAVVQALRNKDPKKANEIAQEVWGEGARALVAARKEVQEPFVLVEPVSTVPEETVLEKKILEHPPLPKLPPFEYVEEVKEEPKYQPLPSGVQIEKVEEEEEPTYGVVTGAYAGGRPITYKELPALEWKKPEAAPRGMHGPRPTKQPPIIIPRQPKAEKKEEEIYKQIMQELQTVLDKEYRSEEYGKFLASKVGWFFGNPMPPLSIKTLHIHISKAMEEFKTAELLKPLLNLLVTDISILAGQFIGYKGKIPTKILYNDDVQIKLNKIISFVLASFDAFLFAAYQQQETSLLGGIFGESAKEKKVRIERIADILKPLLLHGIDTVQIKLASALLPQGIAQLGESIFDVAAYTDIYITSNGGKHYSYARTKNPMINALHYKDYTQLISDLYTSLGVEVEQPRHSPEEEAEINQARLALQETIVGIEKKLSNSQNIQKTKENITGYPELIPYLDRIWNNRDMLEDKEALTADDELLLQKGMQILNLEPSFLDYMQEKYYGAAPLQKEINNLVMMNPKEITDTKAYIKQIEDLHQQLVDAYGSALYDVFMPDYNEYVNRTTKPYERLQLKELVANLEERASTYQSPPWADTKTLSEDDPKRQERTRSAKVQLHRLLELKQNIGNTWSDYDQELYKQALRYIAMVLDSDTLDAFIKNFNAANSIINDIIDIRDTWKVGSAIRTEEQLRNYIERIKTYTNILDTLKKDIDALGFSMLLTGEAYQSLHAILAEYGALYTQELLRRIPPAEAPKMQQKVEEETKKGPQPEEPEKVTKEKPEPEVKPAAPEPVKPKIAPIPSKFVQVKKEEEQVTKKIVREEELLQKQIAKSEEIKKTPQDVAHDRIMRIWSDVKRTPRMTEELAESFSKELGDIAESGDVADKDDISISEVLKLIVQKRAQTKGQEEQELFEEAKRKLSPLIKTVQEYTRLVSESIPKKPGEYVLSMCCLETLQRILTEYTEAKKTVRADLFEPLDTQIHDVFKRYGEALVLSLLDIPIKENITIRTLHQYAYDEPSNIDIWGKVPTIIMNSDIGQQVHTTLTLIAQAGITFELENLDYALAYVCASFDGFVRVLYLGDHMTGFHDMDSYLNLISQAKEVFTYIDRFRETYDTWFSEDTKEGYDESDFDITAIVPGLAKKTEGQEGSESAYIYALDADEEVTFGTIKVPVKNAITPLHKKDYTEILQDWHNQVQARERLDKLKKVNLSTLGSKDIQDQLKELEDIEELVNSTEYADYVKALQNQQEALLDATKQIDAIFAAFAQKIEQATDILGKNNSITAIDFDGPYKQVTALLATYPSLSTAYNIDTRMVIPLQVYLTACVKQLMQASNVQTIHSKVYEGAADCIPAIQKTMQSIKNEHLMSMLEQLSANKKLEIEDQASLNLQVAIIHSFCYILAAHDALEAAISDTYNKPDALGKWSEGILNRPFTWDDVRLSTVAVEAINTVSEALYTLRTAYFDNYIKNIFTQNEPQKNIRDMYEADKLNITVYAPDLLVDGAEYIYARKSKILPISEKKDEVQPTNPITALHTRFGGEKLSDWSALVLWKDYITRTYQNNFNIAVIQRQQDEILNRLGDILHMPVDDQAFENMHKAIVDKTIALELLFGSDKYKQAEGHAQLKKFITALSALLLNKNGLLLLELAKVADIKQINEKIKEGCATIFALICATFDAFIFWAYNMIGNSSSLVSMDTEFATIARPIATLIDDFWHTYYAYLPEHVQNEYPAKTFAVGQQTGAMRDFAYRYNVSKPAALTMKPEPVTVTIKGISFNVFIDDHHAKEYDTIITDWTNALKRATELPGVLGKAAITGVKPLIPFGKPTKTPSTAVSKKPKVPEQKPVSEEIPSLIEPSESAEIAIPSIILPTSGKKKEPEVKATEE